MAQRISRAKRTVAREGVGTPGDLGRVLKVLYLVFNEGYSGDVDLAAEAIRLTRMLARASDEPEVGGLLALMLLHHARRAARWSADGSLVPLADQDRVAVGHRRCRRGRRGPAGRAGPGPARRVPVPGRDRRPALRRPLGRRDRLDPGPRVVRRAAGPHRLTRGRPQPGGRGRRGGRTAGRAAGAARGARRRAAAYRRRRVAARAGRRHRSRGGALRARRRPARATPPSATTSPGRRLDCVTLRDAACSRPLNGSCPPSPDPLASASRRHLHAHAPCPDRDARPARLAARPCDDRVSSATSTTPAPRASGSRASLAPLAVMAELPGSTPARCAVEAARPAAGLEHPEPLGAGEPLGRPALLGRASAGASRRRGSCRPPAPRARPGASRGSQVSSRSCSASLPIRIGGFDQISSNSASAGTPSGVVAA